jgi:6-phosphogluconolactonase/glucosamine-6-phosphate isomerase/deaminase
VTLNPAVLAVARNVLVMAAGEAKANKIRDALRGDRDPQRIPVQLARREEAVWILDEAAAAELDQRER